MTTENKNMVIAGSLTILLFASVIGLLYMRSSNKSIGAMLNEAKLNSERFLSEKLSLDKEIENLKKQMASLGTKNTDLNKQLTQTNLALANKEKELKAVQWDKTKSKKLEAELAVLRKSKSDLENSIASSNATIAQLRQENEVLASNAKSLREQNDELIASSKVAKAINTNNWRADATGKKDKLTVVAKKTNKIAMGFDIPQNVVENINFKITSPDGNVVDDNGEGLTYVIVENGSGLLASVSPYHGLEVTKRIEMTYKPKEKLLKGIYKIDIYEKDQYINTFQIKLR